MASDVSISNLALSHLGNSKGIVSLTEKSDEARACNQWYEQCRDEVLRAFPWPFATMTVSLAVVQTFTSGEWGFSYGYPSDALKLLRAPYGSVRNPTMGTLTRYRVVRSSTGSKLLYFDQDSATIEYITRVTDPGEFAPDFVSALSYLIAARIAPMITSENTTQRTMAMYALYKAHIGIAMENAAAESGPDMQPISDFESARGGWDDTSIFGTP